MRKLFALLFVAGTLSFASCSEEKKGTEEAVNTEAADTTSAVEEAPVAPVDTTAAPAVEGDSTSAE